VLASGVEQSAAAWPFQDHFNAQAISITTWA